MLNALDYVLVDRLDGDRFRGRRNLNNGFGHLFGGQLLGQSLGAAFGTVDDRLAHSMHCYFLRPGVAKLPLDYQVERLRDGRSVSTRRVTALQGDRPIFIMQCSFRIPQPGFEHQRARLKVSPPGDMVALDEVIRNCPPETRGSAAMLENSPMNGLLDVRAPLHGALRTTDGGTLRQYWLRAPFAAAAGTAAMRQQVIALLSDFWLSASGLMPHDGAFPRPSLAIGSIDHTLWFHHPAAVDQWLLFETESPFAQGGTAVTRGLIFDAEGRLVASAVQEFMQALVE